MFKRNEEVMIYGAKRGFKTHIFNVYKFNF